MDLSIKFQDRSFGGKKFRPKTLVYQEKNSNMLLCITPWGRADIADTVADSIKNFLVLANEDSEVTIPYPRKENLHKLGNTLRMAVIMASEKIFNQYNQEEYTTGFEIFAAIQEGKQWIFVSCGQPSLILFREKLGIIPLYQSIDLNVLTVRDLIKDPLPSQLLGLGQNPPIHYGNLRLRNTDRLALISRTYLPNDLFTLPPDSFDPDQISKLLAHENEDVPFWLAFINVD